MRAPSPVNPAEAEAALDRAISCYRAQRYGEALSGLRALVSKDPAIATAWSVLGYLHRDLGQAEAAAAAFDRALQLRPDDPAALNGRARMALERSESDVLDRYAAALRASPEDPKLLLERSEAKLALGDGGAIEEFASLAAQMPQWSEGQIELARMLWESRRDPGFADPVERLLREEPGRLDLRRRLIALLSGSDHHREAARAAREARIAGGGGAEFALLEAVSAGRAGDVAGAEALFPLVPPDFPGRALHWSVHLVRQGKLELARTSIEAALAEDPAGVGPWAVAELIYRKLGDRRSAWLSGQPGLVRALDLPLEPSRLEAVTALLLELHSNGVEMVEQSVRSGTQTRWRLFDRREPELAELRAAIDTALADYVSGLPPADAGHPLLRHRDSRLAITGSWSVRLTAGGHHVSHMHPLGLVSSACYFRVPQSASASGEGRLELGRPPPDLRLDLEPLHVLEPRPGRLILFPSYLHHGTRPFAAGERLTVAFDVARHPAPDG
ncbi:MAG TPA: putative 2OG-Fe(II) oxygenase [Allosphingosinicella sp.]|jgi:tetratricopeptide (TPR) repeat protein